MNLEINYKTKAGHFTNIWKLNNTLLNNQWVKEEIKREIKKYPEINENGNITYENLCDTAKAILRERFIVINADIK